MLRNGDLQDLHPQYQQILSLSASTSKEKEVIANVRGAIEKAYTSAEDEPMFTPGGKPSLVSIRKYIDQL